MRMELRMDKYDKEINLTFKGEHSYGFLIHIR